MKLIRHVLLLTFLWAQVAAEKASKTYPHELLPRTNEEFDLQYRLTGGRSVVPISYRIDMGKEYGTGRPVAVDMARMQIDQTIYSINIFRAGDRSVIHPSGVGNIQYIGQQNVLEMSRPHRDLGNSYDKNVVYSAGDEVLYLDYQYISLRSENQGIFPHFKGKGKEYWKRKAERWVQPHVPIQVFRLIDNTPKEVEEPGRESYEPGSQVWHQNRLWEARVTTDQEPSTVSTEWKMLYTPSEFEANLYRREDYSQNPDLSSGLYLRNPDARALRRFTFFNPEPANQFPDQFIIQDYEDGKLIKTSKWLQDENRITIINSDDYFRSISQVNPFHLESKNGDTMAIHTIELKDGQLVKDEYVTYLLFPWKKEVVEKVEITDDGIHESRYYYYSNPSDTYSYGKLKLEINDSGWVFFVRGEEYKNHQIRSIENEPPPSQSLTVEEVLTQWNTSRHSTASYNTEVDPNWESEDGELTMYLEEEGGQTIHRSYRIKHAKPEIGNVMGFEVEIDRVSRISCVNPDAKWDDPTNRVSEFQTIAELHFKGEPYRSFIADGSAVFHNYEPYRGIEFPDAKTIYTRTWGGYDRDTKEFSPRNGIRMIYTAYREVLSETEFTFDSNGNEIIITPDQAASDSLR